MAAGVLAIAGWFVVQPFAESEPQFTAISSSDEHLCGLRDDGTVDCWGRNHHGQATPPDGRFTNIVVGATYSCGLRTNSTIECWGTVNDCSSRATAFPGSCRPGWPGSGG